MLFEESRRYAKMLELQNKAKDDCLANTSHELRTPLFGIVGMASMLEKTELKESQRQSVDVILSCGNTMLIQVDNFLDFLKSVQQKPITVIEESFDLEELIETSFAMVTLSAEMKQVEMAYLIDSDCPTKQLIADPFRIRQVLLVRLNQRCRMPPTPHSVSHSIPEPADQCHQVQQRRRRGAGTSIGPEDSVTRSFQHPLRR